MLTSVTNRFFLPLVLALEKIKPYHLLLVLVFISPFSEGVANPSVDFGRYIFWNVFGGTIFLITLALGKFDLSLIKKQKWIFYFLTFFLLTIYTSKFLTSYRDSTRYNNMIFYLIPINCLFFFLFISLIDTLEKIKKMINILILFFFVLTIFHLFLWFSGTNSLWRSSYRFSGIFWDPNIFVRNVSIFTVIALTYSIKNIKNFWFKFWIVSAVLVSIFTANFSYSRSGILCIIISILWAGLKSFDKKFLLPILLVASFIGFFFSVSALKNRFDKSENKQLIDYSLLQRVLMIDSALRIVKEHWLLGVGFGNFNSNYLIEYHSPIAKPFLKSQKDRVTSIHNWVLNIWAEQGILALLAIIAYSFLVLWKLLKISNHSLNREIRQIASGLLISLFIFYFFGLTYHAFVQEHFYWVVLGLSLATININDKFSAQKENLG
ncbi:O-antigen ligase family protein [bacterium]|nr:O-antigen ligase family protein [bacterium]